MDLVLCSYCTAEQEFFVIYLSNYAVRTVEARISTIAHSLREVRSDGSRVKRYSNKTRAFPKLLGNALSSALLRGIWCGATRGYSPTIYSSYLLASLSSADTNFCFSPLSTVLNLKIGTLYFSNIAFLT